MYKEGSTETVTENLISMLSKTKDNNEFLNLYLKANRK